MGYETKVMFVTNYQKKGTAVGYCRQEASLEMGKICSGKVGELIDRLQNEVKPLEEKYRDQIKEIEEDSRKIYDRDGNYLEEISNLPEKKKKLISQKHFKKQKALEVVLPYVYDGNEQVFEDSYGNFLLIATLKEVKEAIIKDNAKEITDGNYEFGYRRFNIALKLIEGFETFGEEVLVILFGH